MNDKKFESGYLFEKLIFGECCLNLIEDEKYYDHLFKEEIWDIEN